MPLTATILATNARAAGLALAAIDAATRTQGIAAIARHLRQRAADVLAANAADVSTAREAGLAASLLARLQLNEEKLEAMALAIEQIANQPDPIGQIIAQHTRPDGLHIARRRVPLGSVLFIYESRPNVTTDAAALCLRSGNAVILRGGKESLHCNRVLGKIITSALVTARLPAHAVQVVDTPDRSLLTELLKQEKLLDLVIPRGGAGLIRHVVEESRIPVLKHFDGNCHIYIDAAMGPMQQAIDVVINAKISYPGGAVCNAVEHVLIHRAVAAQIAPQLCAELAKANVELRGDARVRELSQGVLPIDDQDWDTEYLAPVLGLGIVDSLDIAIEHINRHGSHHTDAILSTDAAAIEQFIARVDSASIMVNASTRLADGGEYGLGAEIGISTDKLHARGPMGASDMTTYKWVVTGTGHRR